MKQLTSADSLDDLLTQQEFSLLYFSASWCAPCKSMTPIVEGVSGMMKDRLWHTQCAYAGVSEK